MSVLLVDIDKGLYFSGVVDHFLFAIRDAYEGYFSCIYFL